MEMAWDDGIKPAELSEPFGPPEFAASRSHQDAQLSNENARAAGQAAVLINGGAATAVVAFLAKDRIDPYFLMNVPIALGSYAVGVVFGASMMICTTKSLKYWGLSWREYMVHKGSITKTGDAYNDRGKRWDVGAITCFVAAMASFLFASVTMAVIISRAPHLPQVLGPG
jgi:hypothetical protein